MNRSAALVAMVGLCLPAFAFEVQGLRSGMSLDEAQSVVQKQSYDRIEVTDNQIQAWDLPTSGRERGIFLTFCEGRLILVAQHLRPRFDLFVRLVDEKREALGPPLDAWASPTEATSPVDHDGISFAWRNGEDIVTVTYTEFSSNSQLDVAHEAQHECYPRRF